MERELTAICGGVGSMCTPSKSGKMSRLMLVGDTKSGDEDEEADSEVVKPETNEDASWRMGLEVGNSSKTLGCK
jgi:hypothetical protein